MKKYIKLLEGDDNSQLLYPALLAAAFVLIILGNCIFIIHSYWYAKNIVAFTNSDMINVYLLLRFLVYLKLRLIF